MVDGRLDLDMTRLQAVERVRRSAKSDWSIKYWANVHSQLKSNIKAHASYLQHGGGETVSSHFPGVWNHY